MGRFLPVALFAIPWLHLLSQADGQWPPLHCMLHCQMASYICRTVRHSLVALTVTSGRPMAAPTLYASRPNGLIYLSHRSPRRGCACCHGRTANGHPYIVCFIARWPRTSIYLTPMTALHQLFLCQINKRKENSLRLLYYSSFIYSTYIRWNPPAPSSWLQ